MNNESKPIKILLATGLYPPEIGGPATYARMLEEQLPGQGFEIVTVPYGEVRNQKKWLRHFAFLRLLLKRSKGADVIYALDPVSVGLPAWLTSLITRKPFMIRLGGDYAWEQGQQRFGVTMSLDAYTANRKATPFMVKLLAAVQGFVARRAEAVVVPSEYLKSIVLTWGVEEKNIHVIYSALFPLEVGESKATLRSQLEFDGFVISSVGRLVPWKGFLCLIDVVAKLKEAGLPVSLVIAGDGPDEEKLKARVKELKLEEQVRFVGRLSKSALGAMIKASDCFVLNTGYEGLSHQLLEVMDLNVPVITTNVGGNPELIKDGVTGLMIDFNQADELQAAIKRLHDNEALGGRLVQSARMRTKDFAQSVVLEKIITLLRNVSCR